MSLARSVFAATVLIAFASAAQTHEQPTETSETAAQTTEASETAAQNTEASETADPEEGAAHSDRAPLGSPEVAPQASDPEIPPYIPRTRRRAALRTERFWWGPLALAMGVIAVELETAVGDKASWHLGGALAALPGIIAVSPMPRLELSTGVRFFPAHNDLAPHGFWLGVGGLFWYTESPPFGAGMQGTIGYTFVNDEGPTTSIGAGVRAVVFTSGSYMLALVSPGLHLNVGF